MVPAVLEIELVDGNVAGGANEVAITVEEADYTPIPGVSVIVKNNAQTLTLVSGIADSNGELFVALNDGNYKIIANKASERPRLISSWPLFDPCFLC